MKLAKVCNSKFKQVYPGVQELFKFILYSNYTMAKLLKSIFNTAERRKAPQEGEEEDEKHVTPPMDSRRQLSISRSGRLRQANKKRHSLTLELYGDTIDIDQIKKQTHVEYHVHGPASISAPTTFEGNDNRLDDDSSIEGLKTEDVKRTERSIDVCLEQKLNTLSLESGNRTPEQEIDNAFNVIDKS